MPPDFGPPNLAPVTQLAGEIAFRPAVERVEIWRKLWKRAIIRAVTPHLLNSVSGGASSLETALRQCDGSSPGLTSGSRSITSEFERILNEHSTMPDLLAFLDEGRWRELDDAVGRALAQRATPLCFFLDIVEEDSAYAPLHWLWCMKGLLRQILRFIRKPLGTSDKLHIYVAIREQTWVELGKLMPTSLEQHPAVRVLRWDEPALLEFFARKISLLPEHYLFENLDTEETPEQIVDAWLGTPTVPNSIRAQLESTSTYIVRHTRLIPRDIVVVGNALAREVYAARQTGRNCVEPERIRAAISTSAGAAAWEEMQWCALEIVANWLSRAETYEQQEKILPDEDAAGRVAQGLGDLLSSCSADIILDEELDDLANDADTRFGRPTDLKQLLWRHGLIGWGPSMEGPFRFSYGVGLFGREAPRPEEACVAMHPALIDAVNLTAHGNIPINPFSED
jgi:hypothetical protein